MFSHYAKNWCSYNMKCVVVFRVKRLRELLWHTLSKLTCVSRIIPCHIWNNVLLYFTVGLPVATQKVMYKGKSIVRLTSTKLFTDMCNRVVIRAALFGVMLSAVKGWQLLISKIFNQNILYFRLMLRIQTLLSIVSVSWFTALTK